MPLTALSQYLPLPLHIESDGVHWYRPVSLDQVLHLKEQNKDKKVELVMGNTSAGVHGHDYSTEVFISLRDVTELNVLQVGDHGITVGAAVTIAKLIETLEANKSKSPLKNSLIT